MHLRPPEDCFVIHPGMRDVHFAFKAGGGDFGVLHQPISVPRHLQGEVIEVQLAAASYYPRSHGARWRRGGGMPCGTLSVDWGGGNTGRFRGNARWIAASRPTGPYECSRRAPG